MGFSYPQLLFALYIYLIYNIPMRQKTERKQHLFGIPIPIWSKLEKIQKNLGLSTANDAVQYCINLTYKTEFISDNKED